MRIFPIDDAPKPPVTETPPPVLQIPVIETSASDPQSPRRKAVILKTALVSITFVVIVGVGFLIFRYYQISKVSGALEPLLQNVTLRTSNDVKYEIEPERITYKEFFEKLDKDKSEIDSKIIEIQTIQGRFGDDEIKASLNYTKSCQGLLRALESKAYKQLAVNTSIEWETKARDVYVSSEYYGRYYAKKTYDEAIKDSVKKADEFYASVYEVDKAISETEAARVGLLNFLSDKFILDKDLLAKLAAQNQKGRPTK
jgi:hypothetical protein